MVQVEGFEPPIADSESAALPLGDTWEEECKVIIFILKKKQYKYRGFIKRKDTGYIQCLFETWEVELFYI